MKLEHQVCSLELAKKLKELGVKQESEFYWGQPSYDRSILELVYKPGFRKPGQKVGWLKEEMVAAFTVAELGEMLPEFVRSGKNCGKDFNGKRFKCILTEPRVVETAYTEANARAKCLIYLLENKIIYVDDVNRRISGAS